MTASRFDPQPDTGLADAPFDLPDETATAHLGAALAGLLRVGDVVALRGDLGAGKTALARAIIRARVGDPIAEVPSPTFTLLQTYDGTDGLPLAHYDLYRLDRPEDVFELDFDDALASGATLIEWPDRLGPLLPRDRLDLTLTIAGPTARHAVLTASGLAWADRLKSLRA
ncbi:tRNA (adenosine(37)-N6)-threonylcarbamoyltransferase complex ATPase subunit type 1 TsaE [Rhodospira trueperi]|uniref:tRNA threonylcarbamoyladenosine biosynthesis protein TsaE n=1 Tax=Rhodospira trueperi TaxID=69960 RepID=A0A1G7A2Q6_9PROT|nr:tRNA (adenosine(37)-N6)-threonylcarbamoyltransferase complex ATPase subunit type 1 TsaE [Rhodospira trueperi]SDE09060.1 tRNA threonylcarbamoyladenosine biosynthesis protein TsaE [Rhodospira trueperi]